EPGCGEPPSDLPVVELADDYDRSDAALRQGQGCPNLHVARLAERRQLGLPCNARAAATAANKARDDMRNPIGCPVHIRRNSRIVQNQTAHLNPELPVRVELRLSRIQLPYLPAGIPAPDHGPI